MQIRFTGTIKNKTADSWSIDNIVVSGPEVITYDWLRIDGGITTNGVVSPSGNDAIVVDYNATGCPVGDYTADITITSDDPDEPSEVVAVEFTVAIGGSLDSPIYVGPPISGDILSWESVTGATSYDIYSSTDPYGTFTYVTNVTGTQYPMPMTEAKIFYYVVAKN